jgi:hypothetical protein
MAVSLARHVAANDTVAVGTREGARRAARRASPRKRPVELRSWATPRTAHDCTQARRRWAISCDDRHAVLYTYRVAGGSFQPGACLMPHSTTYVTGGHKALTRSRGRGHSLLRNERCKRLLSHPRARRTFTSHRASGTSWEALPTCPESARTGIPGISVPAERRQESPDTWRQLA